MNEDEKEVLDLCESLKVLLQGKSIHNACVCLFVALQEILIQKGASEDESQEVINRMIKIFGDYSNELKK